MHTAEVQTRGGVRTTERNDGSGHAHDRGANERRSVHDRAERWEWACTRQSAEMGLHTTADEMVDHNTAQNSGDARTYSSPTTTVQEQGPGSIFWRQCALRTHDMKLNVPHLRAVSPAKGLVRTHITCGHHHVKQQRQGQMSHHALIQ